MAGITATGFEPKTEAQILAEIEAMARAQIGPGLDLSPTSLAGRMSRIYAAKFAEAWSALGAVYASGFTEDAAGRALSLRAALTGTTRRSATRSRVSASVTLAPGSYPAGSLVASVVGNPAARFANVESVVNDGEVVDAFDVAFEALEAGPVAAPAGDLSVIAQAVTGWSAITNADDAAVGSLAETDAALRARRRDELRAVGSGTVEAIRADLLRDVPGVAHVAVLENDTSRTDANGVPPHSIECVVFGPVAPTADDDQAVAEQIHASKSASVGTAGSTTRTVTRADGTTKSVSFTRPTAVPAYVEIEVDVATATYAGDAAVAARIADGADGLEPGEALAWTRLVGLPYGVAGVVRVSSFGVSTSPGGPFVQADIPATVRELVTLSSADVSVTSTPV